MLNGKIAALFEEKCLRKLIRDIKSGIANGTLDIRKDSDLEMVTKLFDVIEYAPKKLLELVDKNDGLFKSFIAYRLPKAILASVFNTLFELDNVAAVANQDVDRNDLNFTEPGLTSNKITTPCLVFSRPGKDLFRFVKGMEFDLSSQIRFMKLFNTSFQMLKSDENASREKLKESLAGFDLLDDLVSKLTALNGIKNKLADQGLKQLAGQNVGNQLKQYSYVEYVIRTQVCIFNLTDGKSQKHVNEESIRCWYDFDSEYIPTKDVFTICPNCWKPEYELKTLSDARLINLNGCAAVAIDTEISRTTGIQELVKKGIEALENEKPLQKAGGTQWGAAGSEAGAMADKLLVSVLKARYESVPALPSKNLKLLLHDRNLNSEILNQFKGKYSPSRTAVLNSCELDVKLELPLATGNCIDNCISKTPDTAKQKLDFIKICNLFQKPALLGKSKKISREKVQKR